jgi:hypothetical protein
MLLSSLLGALRSCWQFDRNFYLGTLSMRSAAAVEGLG